MLANSARRRLLQTTLSHNFVLLQSRTASSSALSAAAAPPPSCPPPAATPSQAAKLTGQSRERSDGQPTSDRRDSNKNDHDDGRIFPTSRASFRPNPHAAPLFGHAKRKQPTAKGRRTGEPRQQQSTPPPMSSSPAEELVALRNSTSDPILKDFYADLATAVDKDHVVRALHACANISAHVAQRPSSSSAPASLPAEQMRGVYHLLLRCFSSHALLDEAKAVLLDMERSGVRPTVETLNHVLKAAVLIGDADVIDQLLQQISSLPSQRHAQQQQHRVEKGAQPQTRAAPESVKGSRVKSLEAAKAFFFATGEDRQRVDEPLLPSPLSSELTRNWTSATYSHLLLSAKASHNAEMGLVLLATCLGNGVVLEHEALLHAIALCIHVRECRLAVELANQAERGGLVAGPAAAAASNPQGRAQVDDASSRHTTIVSRRLAPSLWMQILRACTLGGYMPGIELAWQKAVVDGLLVPEEGLLIDTLNVASKHGSVSFCVLVLRRIYPGFDWLLQGGGQTVKGGRRPGGEAGSVLQEWHLAPLFEVQCLNLQLEGAIKTLSLMRRCGHPLTASTTSWLTHACHRHPALLGDAIASLLDIGSNEAFGVDVSAVNALIAAAVWNGKMDVAISLYQQCQGPAATTPALRVRPNLETFHHLFSGCIDARDRDLGARLIGDLNALSLQPTVLTYERMILLCLTQASYEDAFGFMEQAKLNGLRPSRKSYEGLIRKCHSVHDKRWKWALEEMTEAKLYPGRRLCRELGIEEEVWWPKAPKAAGGSGR